MVVAFKALAREIPHETGLTLSRLSRVDIRREAIGPRHRGRHRRHHHSGGICLKKPFDTRRRSNEILTVKAAQYHQQPLRLDRQNCDDTVWVKASRGGGVMPQRSFLMQRIRVFGVKDGAWLYDEDEQLNVETLDGKLRPVVLAEVARTTSKTEQAPGDDDQDPDGDLCL